MAYAGRNNMVTYHSNGYSMAAAPLQNYSNNRPQNVRKSGKHEDAEEGKLFVGGLSWDTTQESLMGYFSQFGEVIDCVVMKNSGTNRSRGFGFVTFEDPSRIEAVLARCPHSLDGRTIDPKACNPRSMQKPKKSNGYPKVFLGGLPSTITETDLRSFFSKYGEVCEVVIMYDQEKKKSRGFGFLSFEDEMARERAVAEHFVAIQNKQVEIKRAEPRTIQSLINGGGQSHKDFSQPPPLSSEQQQPQQQQPPQSWGGAVIHQNGHHLGPPTAAVPQSHVPPPAPQTIQINQIPSPNLNHHSTAYAPQYGSPPTANHHSIAAIPHQPNSHWNQPPPHQPNPAQATPAQAQPQQWASPYASPPPVTASNMAPAAPPFYPTQQSTPTPNYWAAQTSQSDQGFTPKQPQAVGVFNQYSPHPNGAATYPTQYPNIPAGATPNKAPTFNASTEYYTTTLGGGPGPGPVTTPPLVAYPAANGFGQAGPQRGTTVYSTQPVTTSTNFHPYRRQL